MNGDCGSVCCKILAVEGVIRCAPERERERERESELGESTKQKNIKMIQLLAVS